MATIIPACEVVADISKTSKDFIEKEVSAFFQSPDNTLYMLPATPQVFIFSPHRSDNNLLYIFYTELERYYLEDIENLQIENCG